jgi:hypothetical protein
VKFKVGDKVITATKIDHIKKGITGQVVEARIDSNLIKFDVWMGGHDGGGMGRDGYFWYVNSDVIKLATPNNVLSRTMFPKYKVSDCGKYLEKR